MKGTCTGVVAVAGTVLLVGVSYILANEPKGEGLFDYSGGCIQGPSATVGERHARGCASSRSSEADH